MWSGKVRGVAGIALAAAATFTISVAAAQSPVRDWIPDATLGGSRLAGWHSIGGASWTIANGEITATPGSTPGWLILDKGLQDVAAYIRFQCAAPCRVGLMTRMERTPAGGYAGMLVQAADNDYGVFHVVLDRDGRELERKPSRQGPTQARYAPPVGFTAPGPAAPVPGIPPLVRGSAASRGNQANNGGRPSAAPAQPPGLSTPPAELVHDDWNSLSVIADANLVKPILNWGNRLPLSVSEDDAQGFGPIAIYVGANSAPVRIRDVSYKDLGARVEGRETVSARFNMLRVNDYNYAWGAAVADINRDGFNDIIAGPHYYLGLDFTKRREIYVGNTFSPSNQYVPNMVTFAYDWTGDGWPDVLATESRQMALYENPRGEPRRWKRTLVAPGITSELTLLQDLDRDGRPELIFAKEGRVTFAKYDPAAPAKVWDTFAISDTGLVTVHGLGTGDINVDGRIDVLAAAGWWEQPVAGATSGQWRFHASPFADWSRSEGAGGGEMAVFDVNGDKLPDVVTSLNAHGWGLAWFEQVRAPGGEISFRQHKIMGNLSETKLGELAFSELHSGATPGDFDGDGVMDFVTGKRFWAHEESYTDADPNGDAMLVLFRGIRDRSAPGGARFVPEVIHNRSGVGSMIAVADVNKDGAPDVVTSVNRGTFLFTGKRPDGGRRPARAAAAPQSRSIARARAR